MYYRQSCKEKEINKFIVTRTKCLRMVLSRLTIEIFSYKHLFLIILHMCVLGPYKSHAEVGSFSWTGKPKFSNLLQLVHSSRLLFACDLSVPTYKLHCDEYR